MLNVSVNDLKFHEGCHLLLLNKMPKELSLGNMLAAVPLLTDSRCVVRRCSRDFKLRCVPFPPPFTYWCPNQLLRTPVCEAVGMCCQWGIKSTLSRWTRETSELCHNNCCVSRTNRLLFSLSGSRTDSSSFRACRKLQRLTSGGWGLVVKRQTVA